MKTLAALWLTILGGALLAPLVTSCASPQGQAHHAIKEGVIVSVPDQTMALVENGHIQKTYRISTSKYGLGDRKNSRHTPLGYHTIASKIGANAPQGMAFKKRRPTGEIIAPNTPGRDRIVSRILMLQGKEKQNRNALKRGIYIHGTPEEYRLGSPSSYGCVRMASSDIIELSQKIRVGSPVVIENCSLSLSEELLEKTYSSPTSP